MVVKRMVARLLVSVLTFFIGIFAAKVGVMNELRAYPQHVKEDFFFQDRDSQAPYLMAYKKGKREAHVDLQQGILKLKVAGMPCDNEERLFAAIFQKHGLELQRIAGCNITAKIIGNQVGYNEVMGGAIEQRYGAGFVEKLSSEPY